MTSSGRPVDLDAEQDQLDGNWSFDEQSSKKHYRGWLSYAFASEVFVIVSLTLFLPVCLEQFARDNGYLLPDKTVPCSNVSDSPSGSSEASGRCVVKLGWAWIDSASFSLYVYSISVALQALTVISMGGIANHPPHRKSALLWFAGIGSISAILFLPLPSSSPIWPLAALLAMAANVGFGASVVAMNAYLPALAREDKDVVLAMQEYQQAAAAFQVDVQADPASDAEVTLTDAVGATDPLLPSQRQVLPSTTPELAQYREKYTTLLSQATSRISSFGIALGYAAGIILLILTLVPVTLLKGSTFALRLAIGCSGIWWAVFTIPAWAWLPSGDQSSASVHLKRDDWNIWREIAKAWTRLGHMLRPSEIRKLKNTFCYLAAWFLLSDGFTTITSTSILFAKTSLHMPASSLILVGVLTPSAGIIGSLLWPRLQRHKNWSNRRVLATLVFMASLVPAYGCLGFLPFFRDPSPSPAPGTVVVQAARFGGLTTPAEMYVLAVYFGSVYGAFQGYARAFYAELIPPGDAARWYALFSITDKSSSFVGPLVVGVISDLTGNIRYGFFFLIAMIWAAIPILLLVDVEQGRTDAEAYSISNEDDRAFREE